MSSERDLVVGTRIVRAVTRSHPVTVFKGGDTRPAAVVHAMRHDCAAIIQVARIRDVDFIILAVPSTESHVTS